MARILTPLLLACLSLMLVLRPAPAPGAAVTDEQVGAAVKRIQNWFYSRQDPDTGEWISGDKYPIHNGLMAYGEHVLVTYAMLASGESPQDPRMAKAIRFLREHEMRSTYTRSLSAHVWAALPDDYLPNLRDDARWLLKAQTDSLWDYGPKRNNRVDHSTTQYGILGLWEFSKRGGRTPDELWEGAVKHFLKTQQPDGSWKYDLRADRKPSGSMTAAGLTVLYVTLQELYRDADTAPRPIMASIAKGLDWIDQRYTGKANPGGGHVYYYLYCIERVGLASGVKTLNGRDWFAAGAAHILDQEQGGIVHGGGYTDFISTAFALGFLARGRIPIWITKLEVPGQPTNNRPNDVYFLTRYLSDVREAELNWQWVSLDEDAADWANTPVAYLSSDQPLELTDAQVANLRKYLDMGGLLFLNGEGRSPGFTAWAERLTDRLYPGATLDPLPEDHPLYTLIYPVSPGGRRMLRGYSNGARDLIILTTRDVGMTLQSDRDPGGGDIWNVMANLYVMVTDRGTLANRLEQAVLARVDRNQTGSVQVARARYEGPWDIEADAWKPLGNVLFNRTGLELRQTDVALDALAGSKAPLVHLAGVKPIELSQAQKQAIKAYVEGGGTVLVETIGGRGDFSVSIQEQLTGLFDRPPTPVARYEPLLSGQGLGDAFHIRRVVYRPYSVIHLSARNAPRLAAISVGGRPGVIFSHEDLSLGALGVKRWGINGYQPESARELLVNIILAAKRE